MLTPVAWGFSLFRSFLQKLWSPRGRPEFLGLRSPPWSNLRFLGLRALLGLPQTIFLSPNK